jgi:hypothetical protein
MDGSKICRSPPGAGKEAAATPLKGRPAPSSRTGSGSIPNSFRGGLELLLGQADLR